MGNSNGRMSIEAFELILAVRYGNPHAVQALLEKGGASHVNAPDSHGQSPLHHACACGFVQVAKLLMDHGANVNGKDEDGTIPMFLCNPRHPRFLDLLRLMLSHGTYVNARARDGCTMLHRVCRGGIFDVFLEAAKLLIVEHGADVNVRDPNGYTPLFKCHPRNFRLIRLLLENGADVDTRLDDGCTLLMLNRYADTAKLLIEHGADVNAEEENGITALLKALHEGHLDVAKLLIENGANVDVVHENFPHLIAELLE